MDMRSEDRPENIMDHQALGCPDDQVRRIAHYFRTLSARPVRRRNSTDGPG